MADSAADMIGEGISPLKGRDNNKYKEKRPEKLMTRQERERAKA